MPARVYSGTTTALSLRARGNHARGTQQDRGLSSRDYDQDESTYCHLISQGLGISSGESEGMSVKDRAIAAHGDIGQAEGLLAKKKTGTGKK